MTDTVKTPYIETDCVFEFEGRKFESGGAVVTDTHVIGYPSFRDSGHDWSPRHGTTCRAVQYIGATGILNDWHGKPIGKVRIAGRWYTPRSYVGSVMYQMDATINGITYTGRGYGHGMIYKGKRKAS